MAKMTAPPPGLGARGLQLWADVAEHYDLRPDELAVLEQACRTLETIARLDEAMVDQPLVVSGSMGQAREAPLVSEARQQRATLARLLAQLKLPDQAVIADARGATRSAAARHAAQTRWGNA